MGGWLDRCGGKLVACGNNAHDKLVLIVNNMQPEHYSHVHSYLIIRPIRSILNAQRTALQKQHTPQYNLS
jgi:hypothetical protein